MYTLFVFLIMLAVGLFLLYKFSGKMYLLPDTPLKWDSNRVKFVYDGIVIETPAEFKRYIIRHNLTWAKLRFYTSPRVGDYTIVKLEISDVSPESYVMVKVFCAGVYVLQGLMEKKTMKHLFGKRTTIILYMQK